jgi:WD40 repeat protein
MLWDLESGACRLVFEQRQAHTIAMSSDGQYGAWSIGPRRIGVWDLRTGKLHRELESDSRVLLFLPNGERLIGHNFTAKTEWSVDKWEEGATAPLGFYGGALSTRLVKVTEDSRYLVIAGFRRIALWDLQLDREVWVEDAGTDVTQIAMGPHGQCFASASEGGSIVVWGLQQERKRAAYTADYVIGCCDFSSDGSAIIAGDSQGNVHILRVVGI